MFKYNLVADYIREEIRKGDLKPGDKLPSIKNYAKETGYNADTILKAYGLLEKEHLIYTVQKSGYYVVKSFQKDARTEKETDFISVQSPATVNPYKDFYHCMEKSIHIYKNKLFEYDTSQGMEELRAALVKHLMNFQIFTKKQDIFITNGAQQALYILAQMDFLNHGKKVLVEQPTYAVMLDALHCNHVPVVGIKRDKEGIDLTKLEELFEKGNIKFFYTMPRFQNPTGFSYTKEQKREILKLANQYGVFIVEDDYLADLAMEDKGDSLYAMGSKDKIIYIRSFSKTLLPGLRLGMTILPEVLKKEFLSYKRCMDLNTPVLTQGALEIYLKSNMYKTHVIRIRRHYMDKMQALREACDNIFQDEVKYYVPTTGIYAFIEAKPNKAEAVVKRLAENKILVTSIENCYLEECGFMEGIRLCTCNCNVEDLNKVVSLMKKELLR